MHGVLVRVLRALNASHTSNATAVTDAVANGSANGAASIVGNTYKNLAEATSMNSGLTVVFLINVIVVLLSLIFYRYVILREAGLLTPDEIDILYHYPGNRYSRTYTPSDAFVRAPPPVQWTGWPDFFTSKDLRLSRDAQVYLLFQRACILTTAVCGLIAGVVLLPWYWFGGNVFRTKSGRQAPLTLLNMLRSDRGVFERFTSHNLPDDSPLAILQLPVFVIVAMCIVVLYTVVKTAAGESRSISQWLRPSTTSPTTSSNFSLIESPAMSPLQPHQNDTPRTHRRSRPHPGWTLFARGLPKHIRSATELSSMLSAIYPAQVARVELVCKGRMSEARLSRDLAAARYRYDYIREAQSHEEHVDQRFASQTVFGHVFSMFVRRASKEHVLEKLRTRIDQLEKDLDSRQSEPVSGFRGCAFVTFRSASAAESAIRDFPITFHEGWMHTLFRRRPRVLPRSFDSYGESGSSVTLSPQACEDTDRLSIGFPSFSNLYRGLVGLLPTPLRTRILASPRFAPEPIPVDHLASEQLLATEQNLEYSPQLAAARLRNMKATRAPKSGDIIWENIGISFFERTVREIIVQFVVFAILILFTSPIAMLTAVKLLVSEVALLSDPQVLLNNLHKNSTAVVQTQQPQAITDSDNVAVAIATYLMKHLPAPLSSNQLLRSAVFAYVPVLMLAIVLAIVPSILRLTCGMEGYATQSAQEMSVFRKTAFYYVMNAVVLPSVALNTTSEFLEMIYAKSEGGADVYKALPILQRLFSGDIAYFLCNYLVQLALSGSVFWLMRLPSSFSMMIRRRMALTPLEEAEAKCTDIFDYPRHYAYCVTVMSMCLLFGFMAPLIWWFALLYFVCKHLVDLYCIRYVHPRSHIDGRLPRLSITFILVWTSVSQLSLAIIFYLQGWVKVGIATAILCAITLAACLSASPTVGNRIFAYIAELRGKLVNKIIGDGSGFFGRALAPTLANSSSSSSSSNSLNESHESDALLSREKEDDTADDTVTIPTKDWLSYETAPRRLSLLLHENDNSENTLTDPRRHTIHLTSSPLQPGNGKHFSVGQGDISIESFANAPFSTSGLQPISIGFSDDSGDEEDNEEVQTRTSDVESQPATSRRLRYSTFSSRRPSRRRARQR